MPAGDTYELDLEALYQGQAVVNVFHFFQVGGDGTGDVRQSLANAFALVLQPLIVSNLVEEYVTQQFRVRGVDGSETQTLLVLDTTTGGIIDDGLPPNSVLMTRNYGLRDALKGTGRTCWTGIAETDQEKGVMKLVPLAGWVAYENAAKDTIEDPALGWDFQLAVRSPSDEIFRPVLRLETQPRLRTLRSRTIGAFGA